MFDLLYHITFLRKDSLQKMKKYFETRLRFSFLINVVTDCYFKLEETAQEYFLNKLVKLFDVILFVYRNSFDTEELTQNIAHVFLDEMINKKSNGLELMNTLLYVSLTR